MDILDIIITGKQLTNESRPILNPKLSLNNPKIKQKIKKISIKYARLLKERNLDKTQASKRVETIKPTIKKEKLVATPVTKEVTKGGKY